MRQKVLAEVEAVGVEEEVGEEEEGEDLAEGVEEVVVEVRGTPVHSEEQAAAGAVDSEVAAADLEEADN